MKSFLVLITGIIATAALFSCDDLYTEIQDEVDANYFHGAKQFLASDGDINNYFGHSVAVSTDGTTVVVGVPYDDDNGVDSGSVYVFRWNGSSWIEKKITASDGYDGDYFGEKVAVSGDGNTLVIGAYDDDDKGGNSGSVYVFRWDGVSWAGTKITASDGFDGDFFGRSVAISGDGNTMVIGAHGDDDKGNSSGSAYVYRWDGSSWTETKILASDGAEYDWFGISVAVSSDGTTIVVGARTGDGVVPDCGYAYVYRWNGTSWAGTKITASDGALDDLFGSSVAVSGDGTTLVIGAWMDDDKGAGSGSAYVYRWDGSTWLETKITASDGAGNDNFGSSVWVSGDGTTIIAGSNYDDDKGTDSGSAYVYRWNSSSWIETKITASDGTAGDSFGCSVAISGDGTTLVIGARLDDITYANQGSVWLYAE